MIISFDIPSFSFGFFSIFANIYLRTIKFCIIHFLQRRIHRQKLWKPSLNYSHIFFINFPFSNNLIQIFQCFIIFGRNQNPRSILIQSKSKSRFKNFTIYKINFLFCISLQKIIHTKVISMLIARMNYNSSWFVPCKSIIIFIKNQLIKSFIRNTTNFLLFIL